MMRGSRLLGKSTFVQQARFIKNRQLPDPILQIPTTRALLASIPPSVTSNPLYFADGLFSGVRVLYLRQPDQIDNA